MNAPSILIKEHFLLFTSLIWSKCNVYIRRVVKVTFFFFLQFQFVFFKTDSMIFIAFVHCLGNSHTKLCLKLRCYLFTHWYVSPKHIHISICPSKGFFSLSNEAHFITATVQGIIECFQFNSLCLVLE